MNKDSITLTLSIVAAFISIATATVAIMQWRLAKDKLRLDLFEKRYRVYEVAMTYLSAVVSLADVRNDDLHNYNRGTTDAVFLFGPEISDYIKKLRHRTLQMQLYQKTFAPLPVGTERSALVQQHTDELIWLSDQLLELPLIFERYLGFGKSR
jgi:hypothetical protein